MNGELVYEGRRFTIRALKLADGSEPAMDFINALDSKDQATLHALFVRMADFGSIKGKTKFRLLGDKIFEFKSHQLRILGFYGRPGEVILADGIRKKRDKHRPTDLDRVKQYREWFFSHVEG